MDHAPAAHGGQSTEETEALFGATQVSLEDGDPSPQHAELGLVHPDPLDRRVEVGRPLRRRRFVGSDDRPETLEFGRLIHGASVPIGPRQGPCTYTRPMPSSAATARPRLAIPIGVAVVAAALVLGAHLLGTPRNAGPDEASHQVASAALVRGERTGTPVRKSRSVVTFDVPSMAGTPNPACFAFQPDVPVSCNNSVRLSTATHPMGTTSQHYPPLGLVLPGLASYVPWAGGYAHLARLLAAAVPFLLLVAALRRVDHHGPLVRLGLLVGLTPLAWSTMSITNPSGLAIAGGLAIWAAVLFPRTSPVTGDWLLVAGWAAIAASRRDGPLWATLVVLAAALVARVPLADLWRRATLAQRVVAVSSWLATVVFVRTDTGSPFPLVLALSPLGLVAVHLSTPWVTARLAAGRRGRATVAALAGLAATAAALVVLLLSDRVTGGYVATVVESTGEHLVQVVGRLGTLDASAPLSSVILWWVGAGLLLGIAAAWASRSASVVVMLLVGVIVLAWLLEIGSGNRSGSYWQARYSLPLLVGLPLCLSSGARRTDERGTGRVAVPFLTVSTWWVWNATFFAAQRRWSVGVHGALSPLSWDTWGAPLPPVVVLAVHAAASATLVAWAARPVVPTPATA